MASTKRRICILGTMASSPYAGMGWMHGQFLAGLHRLGHDVFYAEATTVWPWHPARWCRTNDPAYPLEYLGRTMKALGLPDRWAYCAAYADRQWYGPLGSQAVEMIRSADAVFNISAATTPDELGIDCNLVYIGTDPVILQFRVANGEGKWKQWLAAHKAHFTYGENIGRSDCPVPPLPFVTHPMRQPIVLDFWQDPPPHKRDFTTFANWAMDDFDITYDGQRYTWSKHHQYLKLIDFPRRTNAKLEIALGMSGASDTVRDLLREHGWRVIDGFAYSLDLWPYRDYIRASRAEFSVAKDMVVRTRCGWFSERSANYLAAGRPVVTQDTGFGRTLPVGEGLFAFNNAEEALAAIDAINSDYPRHSRAAFEIAREYFQAEKVLTGVLNTLGL